jgi:MFS family permease
MRKVFALVGAIVFVDTAFYAAIVPLLPHYVDQLDLSQTQAGVLTASYAAGTLIASLPGGMCAARFGVKPTVLAGLSLMAGSSLVFGFGTSTAVLDGARFAQGIGGAFSWAGGFAWLMATAPAERRGEVAGAAIAAAIFGVVAGPVLGAAAVELGAREVFAAVALTGVGLMAWAVRVPPAARSGEGISGLARGGTGLWAAVGLFGLPAAFAGAINVLLPLRLDVLGAGAVLIGAIFLVAAVVEGAMTPLVGRLSDRRGRLAPIAVGLGASAVIGALLPVISELGLLLAGTVAIVAALAMFWAPASALLSDEAEAIGLDQGVAGALMNLAWAGGQVIGGSLGGAFADAAGDGAAYAVLVVACLLSLGLLARRRGAPATAS